MNDNENLLINEVNLDLNAANIILSKYKTLIKMDVFNNLNKNLQVSMIGVYLAARLLNFSLNEYKDIIEAIETMKNIEK